MEQISLIFTIISITATIANAFKKRWCFIVWLFTNSFWCIYDFLIGAYGQSFLFAVYFVISVFGLIKWSLKEDGQEPKKERYVIQFCPPKVNRSNTRKKYPKDTVVKMTHFGYKPPWAD